MNKRILKIYPAKFYNESIVIIGNNEGLTSLHKVLSASLESKGDNVICQQFIETDGKPYQVIIRQYNNDVIDETWLSIPLHYDDDIELSNEDKIILDKFLKDENLEKDHNE